MLRSPWDGRIQLFRNPSKSFFKCLVTVALTLGYERLFNYRRNWAGLEIMLSRQQTNCERYGEMN